MYVYSLTLIGFELAVLVVQLREHLSRVPPVDGEEELDRVERKDAPKRERERKRADGTNGRGAMERER